MIVRRRLARRVVDMGQHDEIEVRITVDLVHPDFGLRAAGLFNEVLVLQQLLELHADPLPAAGTGIGGKSVMRILAELFKGISHLSVLEGKIASYPNPTPTGAMPQQS